MFEAPSLMKRIAIGKAIGFLFGLAGFIFLPALMPDVEPTLRWGILLWYPTMGAVIGAFGVFSRHPILKLPMPWWFRAPVVGGWLNFVLVLFSYDAMQRFMTSVFGIDGLISSPFWFVLEGAIIGAVIGYFATRYGGEGAALSIEDAA